MLLVGGGAGFFEESVKEAFRISRSLRRSLPYSPTPADSGEWVLEIGYLKIVVKIPDTIYPELVADLEKVQLRDRAERVRVLAMLGLRNMHVQFDGCPNLSGVDKTNNSESASNGAAKQLIKRLSESL